MKANASETYPMQFKDKDVKEILNTLEVEVDIEKEINKYFADWITDSEYGDAVKPNYCGCSLDDCKDIAKHFFELGMSVSNKAQKG